MIYIENLTKKYSDKTLALDDVSLGVERGEFVTIVGHSGAGKTTILKMITAEEIPSQGKVFFESTNVHDLRRGEIPKYRRKIGVVFQDNRLIPNKTAYENIAFAMEAAGRSDHEIVADVPEILKLVGLDNKLWNFPHELSGGERQRVSIARAVINQPELIIADEPTGNLDPINTFDVIGLFKKINEMGTTVILTTHNKGVVDLIGNRVVTVEKGKIIRDDKEGKYVL
ncbi:MAG: Cell division ATP-binding protein FtsE [Parcubacteria group bacterium GW2011_GWF2_38_76]|nr:MAG: Cell division ATP-binding protein FtsE [Parcubacteria group bacterium GW2011_GWF2_38_76]HBM45398.1 cell division ATP-binding protein FtsE [Patescibacteria group bacterium]